MGKRTPQTQAKRQRENAKRDKRRAKEEKKLLRKAQKIKDLEGPADTDIAGDAESEGTSPETPEAGPSPD
jgi:hypothetical protein